MYESKPLTENKVVDAVNIHNSKKLETDELKELSQEEKIYNVIKSKNRVKTEPKPRKVFYPSGITSRAIQLASGYGRGLHNYKNGAIRQRKPVKYVDRKLKEAIYLGLHDKNKSGLINTIQQGCDDERITKVFTDINALKEAIGKFQTRSRKNGLWRKPYQKARKLLFGELSNIVSPRSLVPIDIHKGMDVHEVFSNLQASAGAIAYGYKKEDKVEEIIDIALFLLANPQDPGIPALCFKRSQISNYVKNGKVDSSNIKYKTRLVWCVDAATVLVESRFARPLMDKLLPRFSSYAGGKNDFQIQTNMLNWNTAKYWICLDYSSYDATVPAWIIHDMFDMIKMFFPEKNEKEIDQIRRYFIHTKIIMPDGTVEEKHKGIPSGSYFTQIIGSLVNIQMVLTYMFSKFKTEDKVRYELGSDYKGNSPLTLMAMGDDNVIFTRSKLNIKEIASYIYKVFGVEVNSAKCAHSTTTGENPEFLKRTWTMWGQVRDIVELLLNAVHPERKRSYDSYSPWHILYGYYLTYEGTMSQYFNKEFILKQMDNNGGILSLVDVRPKDMPGSLRAQMLSNKQNWTDYVHNLNSMYKAA